MDRRITSESNCYFSILQNGNSYESDICAIYLLTDSGLASFYAEIKMNESDISPAISEELYKPRKYVKGINWKICGDIDTVKVAIGKWFRTFYIDKGKQIQFVGDANEIAFVKLLSFLCDITYVDSYSGNTKQLNQWIVPTMDNVNSGMADIIYALSHSEDEDGYTAIAYHTNREEFIELLDNIVDIDLEYKTNDKDKYNTRIKKVTWMVRDLKRIVVYLRSKGKKSAKNHENTN